MVILLTIIHVIVCLFLVVVVLLQSGKAADLAGAFGGMGSQTVFGPRGSATVLSKATTLAAALFMVTSLTLSILATRGGSGAPSLLDKAKKPIVNPQQQTQQTIPQPGQPNPTVPINVTPSVDGKKGPTQTIPVPVQSTPTLPRPAQPPAQQQEKK
jgi:preprotein translocase subunit SecG